VSSYSDGGPPVNNLIPFKFEELPVRIADRNGDPWWVLADVCHPLELGSPHKVAERLDDDEKGRITIPTLGGPQEMVIISEPGLYKLIATSRKAAAKRFDRWVRHEVLPQIRKTGSYGGAPTINVRDQAQLTAIALQLVEVNQEQKVALEAAKPKTDFYDNFVNADDVYNLQNAARALGLKPNKFIQWLKQKYLFHQGKALVARAEYVGQGLFEVKNTIVDDRACPQTYVTPKGLQYFAEKLRIGELPVPKARKDGPGDDDGGAS
jgi:prophage antirepressor-like protein